MKTTNDLRKENAESLVIAHSQELFEGFQYNSIECVAICDITIIPRSRYHWKRKWYVYDKSVSISKNEKAALDTWLDHLYFYPTKCFNVPRGAIKIDEGYFIEIPIHITDDVLSVAGLFFTEKRISIAFFKHAGIKDWR